MQIDSWVDSWVGKMPWRRDRLPTPVFLGFPHGLDDKESARNAGDLGLIPGLGRLEEEGTATHSSIPAWRIPMEGGAGRATVHRGRKGSDRTEWLSTVPHSVTYNLRRPPCTALSLCLPLGVLLERENNDLSERSFGMHLYLLRGVSK